MKGAPVSGNEKEKSGPATTNAREDRTDEILTGKSESHCFVGEMGE